MRMHKKSYVQMINLRNKSYLTFLSLKFAVPKSVCNVLSLLGALGAILEWIDVVLGAILRWIEVLFSLCRNLIVWCRNVVENAATRAAEERCASSEFVLEIDKNWGSEAQKLNDSWPSYIKYPNCVLVLLPTIWPNINIIPIESCITWNGKSLSLYFIKKKKPFSRFTIVQVVVWIH